MLEVLSATGPIYVLVALGFLLTRIGVFDRAKIQALGLYVSKVALPCLVGGTLARSDPTTVLNPTYLTTYGLASLLAFGIGVAVAIIFWKSKLTPAAFVGMGAGGSNSAFMGYPIALVIVPEAAGLSLGMNAMIEMIILIPLILLLADLGAAGGSGLRALRRAGLGLFKNPILIGVLLGLIWSFLPFELPGVLDKTLSLVGAATSPVALFYCGGMLVGLNPREHLGRAAAISGMKLLLHPALAMGVLWLLTTLGMPPLDPEMRTALLITAALPCFMAGPIYASKHGLAEGASAAVAVSTVMSFLTLSALIAVLH